MATINLKGDTAPHKASKAKNDTTEGNVLLNDKTALLKDMNREDLIDLFKEWAPRKAVNRKKSAPLDQRLSIVVSERERAWLDRELQTLERTGEKTSISKFVRNKALGSVDIHEWRERAEKELAEIERIYNNQIQLKDREKELVDILEDIEDDDESVHRFENELSTIREDFKKITAQQQARKHRLSGRMSMPESETIKWRAQRLCISTSDFLRMLIFDLQPAGDGDAHMSYQAKLRFYISILDVAENGWGTPPEMAYCSQCDNYLEEIRRLQNRIKQLDKFI